MNRSQLAVWCERVGYNAGMVANATTEIKTAKRAILPRADARAGEEKSATVSFWSHGGDTITVSSLSTHGLHGFYDQEPSNVASVDQSNQQYSILALTDSSGNVSERYAYTAYGQPMFLNASATVQTSSAAGNRYTYTAREWDATLGLHHFRARWMSGLTGRFLSRDPIGYVDGELLYAFIHNEPYSSNDPLGTCAEKNCCGCKGKFEVESFKNQSRGAPDSDGRLSSDWVGVEMYLRYVPDGGVQKAQDCGCDEISMVQMASLPPYPWTTYGERPMSRPFIDTKPLGGPLVNPRYNGSGTENSPWTVKDHPKRPRRERNPTGTMSFETCAVCIRKDCPPSILGCTSWGFTYDGDPSHDTLFGPTVQGGPSSVFLDTLATDAPGYGAKACDRKPPKPIPPFDSDLPGAPIRRFE